MGCEKYEVSRSVKNAIFYCIDDQSSDECYTEYFLVFDKPYSGIVTDSIVTNWYVEPASQIQMDPIQWRYSIDGSVITFEKDDDMIGHQTRTATYRKDSIYYIHKAYYRR